MDWLEWNGLKGMGGSLAWKQEQSPRAEPEKGRLIRNRQAPLSRDLRSSLDDQAPPAKATASN